MKTDGKSFCYRSFKNLKVKIGAFKNVKHKQKKKKKKKKKKKEFNPF